ncbi:MAG TPA: hypothetical protein PKN41_12355 [Bacteroidales bacterium]|nr:hypothetical protein [Bacteroidales bacterium]
MNFLPIREYLPEIFHRLLPDIFLQKIPAEIFTKCSDCHMICNTREELGLNQSKPFAPDTKCCTFMPQIPNFLAGALLSDTDPLAATGKNRLLQRIENRKGIFPHGVYPVKKYSLLYEAGRELGFGKSRALRCPYFIEGKYNCALWKYREAICATWFCKYVAQQAGFEFWDAVKCCIKYVEDKLTLHFLARKGMPLSHPYGDNTNISYEDLDDLPMNDKEYRLLWGKWAGREKEFYLTTYSLFQSLTPQDFSQIMGEPFKDLLSDMEKKYHRMTDIPMKLVADRERAVYQTDTGNYHLEMITVIERNNSCITHAFDIPAPVIDIFDGNIATEDALQQLEKNHGIFLGKDILISLYQYGILLQKNS